MSTTTTSTTTTTMPPPTVFDWQYNPNPLLTATGTVISGVCEPGGTAYPVYGVTTYTSDSSVCTAAVFEGRITFADGGPVTYRMEPGQSSYAAGTANGVTTLPWGTWPKSYVFLDV